MLLAHYPFFLSFPQFWLPESVDLLLSFSTVLHQFCFQSDALAEVSAITILSSHTQLGLSSFSLVDNIGSLPLCECVCVCVLHTPSVVRTMWFNAVTYVFPLSDSCSIELWGGNRPQDGTQSHTAHLLTAFLTISTNGWFCFHGLLSGRQCEAVIYASCAFNEMNTLVNIPWITIRQKVIVQN